MTTNQDCECGDSGCCTPKKKPGWTRILSVIVLLLALSIILFKVFDRPVPKQDPKQVTEKSSCCDTAASKDTATGSCCPKN